MTSALTALAGVFRVPDLRRLQLGYFASLVGLWGHSVAVAVYAFDEGGATLVGIAALVRLIPAAVVAPFAAVLADRHSRRLVLIAANVVRALLIGAAAAAVALAAPVALVLGLVALVGVVSTVVEPAKNALLPSLVDDPEQLTAANVAATTFESAGMFVGPAVGGILVGVASIEVAFAVTAGLLVVSSLLIARIGARDEPGGDEARETEGLLAETLAGVRVIAHDWKLRLIVGLTAAQVVVDGALGVLIVVISIELLGLGDAGVGFLNAAAGIGGLLGATVAVSLAGSRGLGSTFGIGVAVWSAPLALIPLFPEAAVVLVLMGVIGAANTVLDSALYTLLQRATPDEVRGRVFGALETLVIAGVALGAVAASAAIEWAGIEATLVGFGLFLPLLALAAAPRLRRIDAEIAAPAGRVALLRRVPMFAPLGAAPLEQLASQLERLRVDEGEEVVRQGEPGELFYVIEEGEVEVHEDGALARVEGPGDHFGEIALLRDVPRTATVRARSPVTLLTLEREHFIAAVTGHARSAEAADAVIADRLGSVKAGAGAV